MGRTSTTTNDSLERYERTGGLDLESHVGLRGFLAVWVAAFHCLLYSDVAGGGITLQASGIMPAFFTLSGFTLAVVYRAKTTMTKSKPHRGDVEMAASCTPSEGAAGAVAAGAADAAGAASKNGVGRTTCQGAHHGGECPSSSSTAPPADDEVNKVPGAWRARFFVNRFARLVGALDEMNCLDPWLEKLKTPRFNS